jgi:hypothetical protein
LVLRENIEEVYKKYEKGLLKKRDKEREEIL